MRMMPKSFTVTPTLLLGDAQFKFTEGALPDHQSEHNTQPYPTFFLQIPDVLRQMHVSDFSAFTALAFTRTEKTNEQTYSFITFHSIS